MPGSTGYQPRTTPAERRAFFDLQRQINELRRTGGGGNGGEPGPTIDEVWVSATAPTDPEVELWFDTDAPVPSIGVDEVWIGPAPPTDEAIELWYDFDAVGDPIVGDPGPKGDTGDTGPAGADGATGPPGPGVAAGGTTDQVLAKNSATNYDTKWVTPAAGGGGGTDEVWISPTAPTDTAIELWYDSDDPGTPLGSLATKNTVASADIDNDAVTNAKLANMVTQTFKGRTSGGSGDPEDLTVAQVKSMLSLNEITVASSAPGSPAVNDLWVDTT